MADRQERIRIFEGTMRLAREHAGLKQAVAQSIAGQHIAWEEDALPVCPPRYDRPAALTLSALRSMEAAARHARMGRRVCVLNFASPVCPGGGVVNGAVAQEECLCRISTLYPALTDRATASPFYDRHWQMIRAGEMNRRNRDDCIYTPGVTVVRADTEDCEMLPEAAWYMVDVATCAAPDLRCAPGDGEYAPDHAELMAVLEQRWRRILASAANAGADALVLGAFGCGVFANPPEMVAEAFCRALAGYERCFEEIEFAVWSREARGPNYRAFLALPGIREI